MEIFLSDDRQDEEWDNYLSEDPYAQHEQTSYFSRLRKASHFDSFRLLARENGRIVGGVQVLLQDTLFGPIGIFSQGTISDVGRCDVAKALISALDKEALNRKLTRLEITACRENGFSDLFKEKRFVPCQPPSQKYYVGMIDLSQDSEAIFNNMNKSTRYKIRHAEKNGVHIQMGGRNDLEDFYSVHCKTAAYKNFPIFPIDYFYYLWDLFGEKQKLFLFLARKNNIVVSSIITTVIGNRLYFGWGGIDRSQNENKANSLLHWTAIQHSQSMGLKWYDFGSFNPASEKNVSVFKRSFGVQAVPCFALSKLYQETAPIRGQLFKLSKKDHWVGRKLRNLNYRLYIHKDIPY